MSYAGCLNKADFAGDAIRFDLDNYGVMPYSTCHNRGAAMTEEKKDTKTLLAEAVKKRDELNTFIKVLQEMLGETDVSATGVPASARQAELMPGGDIADPFSVVYPGLFFGKSQSQASKLLLERVKRPLKTKVIVECLDKGGLKVGSKNPAVNLWGILYRSKEIFVLVPKAGWGLVDWYDLGVLVKMRKKQPRENGEEESVGEDDK